MIRIVPSYLAGLMLGVLGLVFCIGAFKLGFWGDDGPGPGLVPLVAGGLLIPLIVVALREPIPDDETSFKIQPVLAVGLTLIYALALPRAGFVPATLVLLALWIRGFYRQSWLRAAIVSACLTAFGIFIFYFLLKVPMRMFPGILMIDALQKLAYGLQLSLEPANLLYALIGSILGTLVGVLPGLGPVTTIAVLLPVTYHAGSPLGAIIMLASIYYGAMYGGSTTSILLKVPGEAASVVTCIDGHEMAKQGRAGPALAIAAIGSFIAGTGAVCALVFVGPMFAKFAVSFGPPEYFALALFGLALSATLSGGSPVRGFCMVLAGLLLGLVGIDTVTGVERYTFGILEISDGIDLVPMLMGLFGIGEILHNLEEKDSATLVSTKIGRLFPSRQDWKESTGPIARGSVIGFLVGLIPGGGAILASLMSYTLEKKLSKTPEKFGRGAIAGVAGPESANNSAATASFIPLLTLGLPGNAVTAVLFAGLLIQNVQPGPLMLVKSPEVFWGVIASMYVGNIMLLILNLPLVGLWVQLLRVPFWILSPGILLIAIFGTYSLRSNFVDVGTLMIFGAVGYILRKASLDAGPLIMAFILANILDTSLRQSLLMGDGSMAILINRPISATILAFAAVIISTQAYQYIRGSRAGIAPGEITS